MKRAHLSPNCRAYTSVGFYFFQVIIGASSELEPKDGERESAEHAYGWKPVWLKWGTSRSKRATWMSLTAMTVEELEVLKKVINIGIDEALIVARDLDKQAVELMYAGAEEVPYRALASAPPYFERPISLEYERPVKEQPSQDPDPN